MSCVRIAALTVLLTPAATPGRADDADPKALARVALDDARPSSEREAVIRDHPSLSAGLIAAMTADLAPGTKEEARRIPWIWRVAIAAGKRNDAGELKRLLDLALPKPGAALDQWRAVVVGGGLVNGITLAGDWPGDRIARALEGDDRLATRWARALELAEAMADDPDVSTGTRYDALRMVGVEPWDRGGGRLFRYLLKGVHPELQQGAVSAIGDVRSPAAAQALLSGFHHYSEANRGFALDALLRDEGRASALLDALADGRVSRSDLGAKRAAALRAFPAEGVRTRAEALFPK